VGRTAGRDLLARMQMLVNVSARASASLFFVLIALDAGPRRPLILELSDEKVSRLKYERACRCWSTCFFFFITLHTGPRRTLILELSD